MPTYELQPVDTLFFRDARPMDAGGHGANWPLPTVTHEALRAALLRAAGELPRGKPIIHHKKRRDGTRRQPKAVASDCFRSLRTIGPFPLRHDAESKQKDLYFVRPSDLAPDGDTAANTTVPVSCLSPIANIPANAQTNLPAAWLMPVAANTAPSKATLPQWVTADWFRQYLADDAHPPALENYDAKLYTTEHRIGIAVDSSTHATKEGQFYTAEHLRLCDETRLWIDVKLNDADPKQAGGAQTLAKLTDAPITLGGESRMCHVRPGHAFDLAALVPPPALPPSSGNILIKWVLVTPAVFNNGWRPNWVRESDGQVMLKSGDIAKRHGEDRRTWRERIRTAPGINAKLIGVCLPKPTFFSGWDVNVENNGQYGGPKPTVMAVASGSVYYFKAADSDNAAALIRALHGRTQSDCFGEKGLGLGFCGVCSYLN